MTANLAEHNRGRGGDQKILPVVFVCTCICSLWLIYMIYYCIPKGESSITVTFNCITAMLVFCYIRCIQVDPGGVPENDPSWHYVPQTITGLLGTGDLNLQEKKKTGDRRHCKWCAKYKPDRCHHCRVCRRCILMMDHHCPWIFNCVGFGNHKYFFLVLMYTAVDTNLVFFSMLGTVIDATEDHDTPFTTMFALLFCETLAGLIGALVTTFFLFHVWLMFNAMTTIEFCEKRKLSSGYGGSPYDDGCWGNLNAVLGDRVLLWFLPCSPPSGSGLIFGGEARPLKAMEANRGIPRKLTASAGRPPRRDHLAAGTGSAPGSGSCFTTNSDRDFAEA